MWCCCFGQKDFEETLLPQGSIGTPPNGFVDTPQNGFVSFDSQMFTLGYHKPTKQNEHVVLFDNSQYQTCTNASYPIKKNTSISQTMFIDNQGYLTELRLAGGNPNWTQIVRLKLTILPAASIVYTREHIVDKNSRFEDGFLVLPITCDHLFTRDQRVMFEFTLFNSFDTSFPLSSNTLKNTPPNFTTFDIDGYGSGYFMKVILNGIDTIPTRQPAIALCETGVFLLKDIVTHERGAREAGSGAVWVDDNGFMRMYR